MTDRFFDVTGPLDLSQVGLEIAPYFNPVVVKSGSTPVQYTDYIDNDEIQRKAAENPALSGRNVPPIDFVWRPGSDLGACVPRGTLYSYVIASHVIEHVPDVLGWLNQLFSVLEVGKPVALIVPDRRRTMDYFRQETTPAALIDAWVRRQVRPSVAQIFDFLSRAVDDQEPAGQRPFEIGTPFQDAKRHYTDADALHFAVQAWNHSQYLDVHCTVWTPESFVHAMVVATQLGILNADILNPTERQNEFVIHLIKRGEPTFRRPPLEGSSVPVVSSLSENTKSDSALTQKLPWSPIRIGLSRFRRL